MTKKALALFLLTASLSGCITPGQFEIYQPDTRFTKSDRQVFESKNNRISTRSFAGGIHIDTNGVYINPMAVVDSSGKTLLLALRLENITDHNSSMGAPNSLGRPQAIHFNVDGKLISLDISDGQKQFGDTIGFNSVANWASVSVAETGIASLTKEEFQQIINARVIAVKIDGTTRSATYEDAEIEASFRANLRTFYDQTVK